MRIILMGTGPFAVPSFDAIERSKHQVIAVVTKPEPPVKSRKGPPPSPVRAWAMDKGLMILDPPNINEPSVIAELHVLAPDLLVVCDYGQILKPAALAVAPLGGINLHGSLLPAYRGAAPVQRSLLSGDSHTGVSVIHMTPRLDGGPILGSVMTAIEDHETAGDLEVRLSRMGVPLVIESIEHLSHWDGRSSIGIDQDVGSATKAPRLSKQEAEIDWSRTVRQIDCHVRGMQPWPIAYAQLAVRPDKPPLRISILRVSSADPAHAAFVSGLQPGQITGGKELVVATGDGALRIDSLCPAGKREMTGEEFMRGYALPRGTAFQ